MYLQPVGTWQYHLHVHYYLYILYHQHALDTTTCMYITTCTYFTTSMYSTLSTACTLLPVCTLLPAYTWLYQLYLTLPPACTWHSQLYLTLPPACTWHYHQHVLDITTCMYLTLPPCTWHYHLHALELSPGDQSQRRKESDIKGTSPHSALRFTPNAVIRSTPTMSMMPPLFTVNSCQPLQSQDCLQCPCCTAGSASGSSTYHSSCVQYTHT